MTMRKAGLEASTIFILSGFCIAEKATKGMSFSGVTLQATVNTYNRNNDFVNLDLFQMTCVKL